jgi:hypothetical protein
MIVRQTCKSEFYFGAKVYIDGAEDLTAVITGLMWRDTADLSVEISWLNSGMVQTVWVHPRRLTLV